MFLAVLFYVAYRQHFGSVTESLAEPARARSMVTNGKTSESVAESTTRVGAGIGPSERDKEIIDVFAPRTWEPIRPKATPTPQILAAPMIPQAPPLPFRFSGRLIDPDRTTSFVLTRGNEMITVRVGQRLEPSYLVESFDGTSLHFRYLPLNASQSLFIGKANE